MANRTKQFERLHDRYQKTVAVHARTYYIWDLMIEEVEDELWYAVFQAYPKFDPKRGANEKTFIERVCRNRAIDLWRESKTNLRYTIYSPVR